MANTSPSWMSPSKSSSTALAFRCSVPTWTAMSCEPCMIVSPLASCSAQLKSRLKITNEWHVRRICSAISSTTVTNEFLSTSKVTGSSVFVVAISAHLHHDVQVLVDLGFDAGRHERCRVELVDHGGTFEAHAGRQLAALVDGRVDGLAVKVHVAALDRLGQVATQLVLGKLDLGGLAGRDDLQPVELHGRVVAAVGELA